VHAFRDDLVGSNILFTTYNTLKFLKKHQPEPTPVERGFINGAQRGLDWIPPVASLETHPEQ
jgi:hypothetical protein